jgi:hypothetical protein
VVFKAGQAGPLDVSAREQRPVPSGEADGFIEAAQRGVNDEEAASREG